MFENEDAKQAKQKSYIKHTEGSFSLGKTGLSTGNEYGNSKKKSARASALYKHISHCTGVNL